MIKKIFGVAIGLFAFIYLPAVAQNVAVVNGKSIPAAEVDNIVRQFVQRGQPDSPELRAKIKEDLIMREILVQEANKKKLGSTTEVKEQMDLNQKNLLIRALMADYLKKNPVKPSEIKAEYDRLIVNLDKTEYRGRHILVESEAEAKNLIAQLNAGAKFDDLARKFSKDPGSANNGGDLNWAGANNYVKPFGDALVSLKPGEVTQTPVKTQFGYHVIKLEEKRPMTVPTLQEATPRIERALQEQKLQAYQEQLAKKAVIK